MKNDTYLKAASIAVMILGCIHLAATPVIFSHADFHNGNTLSSLYMFVMVGISTVFIGWIQHFVLNRWNLEAGYRIIFQITALFLTAMGIGAVTAMRDNPFAYICLLISLVELFFLRRLKKKTDVKAL
jgi:hypothetical protein